MYRPPSSPYCGFSRDGSTNKLSLADGACHLSGVRPHRNW